MATAHITPKRALNGLMSFLSVAALIALFFAFKRHEPVFHAPHLSVSARNLPYYAFCSFYRMLAAYAVALAFSLVYGLAAARSKTYERVMIPAIDIAQSVPVVGFFPAAIYFFVALAHGSRLGVELAAVFLIFTSMAWNITFGVYEAVKSIPDDLKDIAKINHLSRFQTMKSIYVPAAMPRIAYQTSISWAVGLFYLVTSEIFSTGSQNFSVKYGIGTAIANLVVGGSAVSYVTAIAVLIIAILLTRFLFLMPFTAYSERYSFKEVNETKRSRMLAFYAKPESFLKRLMKKAEV
jgi:NitT/TauT family transport system permease protein